MGRTDGINSDTVDMFDTLTRQGFTTQLKQQTPLTEERVF